MKQLPLTIAVVVLALAAISLSGRTPLELPTWLALGAAALALGFAIHELAGRPIPFLRWSFLRMALGMKKLTTDWQVGDGREQRVADHVRAHARPGDVDHAIETIDAFAYRESFLINVGDVKGALLDAAVDRARPRRALELGCYIGYSALRTARRLPEGGRLYSIEFNDDNARLARSIVEHAGMGERIEIVHGTLGDGGATIERLEREHGFAPGSVDFVFIDHAKEEYLPDLRRILERGWLRTGAIVVADNIRFPGAPDYLEYMRTEEGRLWSSREHATKAEYQSVLPDLVLESELLRAP